MCRTSAAKHVAQVLNASTAKGRLKQQCIAKHLRPSTMNSSSTNNSHRRQQRQGQQQQLSAPKHGLQQLIAACAVQVLDASTAMGRLTQQCVAKHLRPSTMNGSSTNNTAAATGSPYTWPAAATCCMRCTCAECFHCDRQHCASLQKRPLHNGRLPSEHRKFF